MVHEQMRNFFNGFRRDAHPMAIMVGVVGALSAFYHDTLRYQKSRTSNISALRLIAKMPTIAAMCYKYSIGQPFMPPQNKLSYAENFLHMMFGTPCEETTPNPVFSSASIEFLFCMLITNKMLQHQQCDLLAQLAPIHLPVFQQVLVHYGDLHMAVRMKRY